MYNKEVILEQLAKDIAKMGGTKQMFYAIIYNILQAKM